MSLVATLQQNHQERTAEAAQQYREILERAKTLDEYRALLGRDSSDDAEQMTTLMTTLKLSVDDVAADFHALQSHRAATERILTNEKRDELDVGLAETLKQVSDETGGALAKLWAMIPHQNCPLVFHHLLGSLLGSVPPENRQAAAELARVPEWSMRVRVAQTEHGATITADRQGRVEIARLEQSNPRVLGSVE